MTPETPEVLLRATLDCYLSAIIATSDCLDAIAPSLAGPRREQLLRLRNRLAFEPSVATLNETRETLRNELNTFAGRVQEDRDARQEDLRKLQVLLARSADLFAIRRDGYADQFRHFSRAGGDSAKIEGLLGFVESVCEENAKTLSTLCQRIEELLDPAAKEEKELDRQLASRLASGRDFCLLLFQLASPASDDVVGQVGSALSCHVRARDFVSHTEDGQFIALLECSLAPAQTRARDIAQWLSGNYRTGAESLVEVQLKVGVAERAPGDTVQSLLGRAKTNI